MGDKVSKKDAEAVVQYLKRKWPEAEGYSHQDGPFLHDADHEEQSEGAWSISWEGAPIDEWAVWMSMDADLRKHFHWLHFEALYSWCLGIYAGWE